MRRRVRLPDGTLGPFEDVFGDPSPEEKVEILEAENAQLIYDSMMKDLKLQEQEQKINEIESIQAGILYELMIGGTQ